MQRSVNVEAITHLTRGIALVQTLPDGSERNQQELSLQVALGVPLVVTGGFASAEAKQVYTRALALCEQVGETPQLFPALVGVWSFYNVRAGLTTADEVAQRAEDPALLLMAHQVMGTTCSSWESLSLPESTVKQGWPSTTLNSTALLLPCMRLTQGWGVSPLRFGLYGVWATRTKPSRVATRR